MTRYRIIVVNSKETGGTMGYEVQRRRFWFLPFLWETVKVSNPYGICNEYASALKTIGQSMAARGEVAVKQEFV